MTRRLYYEDSFIRDFTATVLECRPAEDGRYLAVLDSTAFFPEGGGQYADTGLIGGGRVLDVQETDGAILHTVDAPLKEGETYRCSIDWDQRFRRMQCHTGEHIVSGIGHRLYGYDNVGFHLGADYVTLDFDGPLTREQLDRVEDLAAEAVFARLPVETSFPAPEELPSMEYRSKLDLTENVRIVTIPGVDACACCAPHVRNTGEIGLIKILDFAKHKQGVRLFMTAGFRALEDYRARYTQAAEISSLLATPQAEIAEGVKRLQEENSQLRYDLNGERTRSALVRFEASGAEKYPSGNAVFFTEGLDYPALIAIADKGKNGCEGMLGIFSANEDGGYKYVIISNNINLSQRAKAINQAISGRGGGRPNMIQGMCSAPEAEIKAFFAQDSFTL